jgi:hypothetical protein
LPSFENIILRMDSRLADLSANLELFVSIFGEADKFPDQGLYFLHRILTCLCTPVSVGGRANIY